MNFKFIAKGVVLTALATIMFVPMADAQAAESVFTVPVQNREIKISRNTLLDVVSEIQADINIEETIKIESSSEIAFRDMFRDNAFALLGEDDKFLYVRAEADEESDWVGKIGEDMLLEVVEKDDEYAVISSGNLTGYVKIENLILGKNVSVKVKEYLEAELKDVDIYTLDKEAIEETFKVAETREEEEARLAAEEAKRIAEEKAREKARKEAEERARRERGQSVVSYAKQFLGNPYVYGGTSLTNGTDCSGFVMRVYQNFGIQMPRTSSAMRGAGRAVSYSDMQPGDVVCYSGHVGIYAGNSQIVNAIDSAHGIGMTNVNYAPIITIRRMF